ncbi:MAG: hypothetical protein U1F42_09615 [Candidatus Competibacteraceae bacterium]
MFIIWGSGSDTKDLGVVETKHCDTCEKERPFKLILQYRYRHLYYLFSWISQKKYLLICDVCHHGCEVDSKKIEPKLKKNPIPFQRRYGWTFLVGLVAFFIAFGMYYHHTKETKNYSYISSPQVNDLYVTDLSRLLKYPERSPMYGVMRVKSVDDNRVALLISKIGYNKTTGPSKDINSGRAANNEYYDAAPVTLSAADLKNMHNNQTITDIRRN